MPTYFVVFKSNENKDIKIFGIFSDYSLATYCLLCNSESKLCKLGDTYYDVYYKIKFNSFGYLSKFNTNSKYEIENYTDYEKLKIGEQYNKLYSNIYEKNKENI